jgi:hypothetical protein
MRSLLRAGLALGLLAAACKDSAAPGDFTDPVAVTSDMQAVDSAFDSDVYRSFGVATLNLGPAATGVAPLKPAATLLGGTLPKFNRSSGRTTLLGALQAQRLQQLRPAMSVAAAQGRIIPDSLYGRVFQWDTAIDQYTFQDSVVSGLTGVRFILYQVDDFGSVVEPVVEVGTLDLIDESTSSLLQLHILVKGLGGTPTYVDYTASISATEISVSANATGFISNGLSVGNKTLTFDETFVLTDTRITANATFTLNSPARVFTLNESVTVSGNSLIITGDFRFTRPGETVQFYARLTLNFADTTATISATVRVNGRTVATLNGDLGDPGLEWLDAGGDPLTADDLEALAGLENAAARFQEAVNNLFLPVENFFGG